MEDARGLPSGLVQSANLECPTKLVLQEVPANKRTCVDYFTSIRVLDNRSLESHPPNLEEQKQVANTRLTTTGTQPKSHKHQLLHLLGHSHCVRTLICTLSHAYAHSRTRSCARTCHLRARTLWRCALDMHECAQNPGARKISIDDSIGAPPSLLHSSTDLTLHTAPGIIRTIKYSAPGSW